MICTGAPAHCQCNGACPMLAAERRGDRIVPMNQAARDAMDKQGEKYDASESAALERFLRSTGGA